LHVFFKEPIDNEKVDVEEVISNLEASIPNHLREEIEMVVIGYFEEFEERHINAFYKDGALYISNIQDSNEDLYDDLVHETAHSLESPHGYFLYGDEKIKDEFLRKRKYLYDILWARGYKAPLAVFMDTEYNQDFDMFLYEKVGYDKLSAVMTGIFINAYAATSLSEYFATGFVDFYINSDHKYLKQTSPALYEKLFSLQKEDSLDNEY
tara:strand:+ start:474 stop:1100 length:627 start_codon:yes stop_codon:yes gene_type:complete